MKTSLSFFLTAWALCPLSAPAQVVEVTPPETETRLSPRVYSHWTMFLHPRYGYELPVPPGVRAVGEPEAAARTKFVSPDGAFVMSAWGGRISDQPASVIAALWARAKSNSSRTVNYERRAGSWYVVSGTDTSGTEFYEKAITRGNRLAVCTLTYPHARQAVFGPWVEGIENAFRTAVPPDGTSLAVPASLPGGARADTALAESPGAPRRSDPPSSPAATDVSTISRNKPQTPAPSVSARRPGEARSAPPLPTQPDLAPATLEPPPIPKTDEPAPAANKPDEIPPEIPLGEKVPGKPDFVYTPFYTDKTLVDVAGIAAGTKVKCPYTGKIFRVP